MQTIFTLVHDIAEKCTSFDSHADPLAFLSPRRSDDGQAKATVANIRDDTKDSDAPLGEKNRFL